MIVSGNPNDPNSKVIKDDVTISPEDAANAKADAANHGKSFRVRTKTYDGVNADGSPKVKWDETTYKSKAEQEAGADFLTEWLFKGVTPRRDSLDGGALIVISADGPEAPLDVPKTMK